MSGSRHYHSTEQRQAEIIKAVVQLCGEQNSSTLTTTTIAKRINLSQGALFKHFPNKDSLWEAVAHWLANSLITKVTSTADNETSSLKGLEVMFLAHVDFISKHPGAPRLMLGELQKPEKTRAKTIIRQALIDYRARVFALLTTGIQKGEIQSGLDTEAAAITYLGAIQGLVVQALVSGEFETARSAAPRVFKLFRDSLTGRNQ